MLQITITRKPDDVPFTEMSRKDLFERATRSWVMNPARAAKERYAIIVGDGLCVMAIEIADIELDRQAPEGTHFDDRYRINGTVLTLGHPVYDNYVGKKAIGTRNPVRYVPSEAYDGGDCLCGCGERAKGFFLPGHDQRAIHQRVSKVGSVKQFLEWFDATYTE